MQIDELDTPAAWIDLDAMERNIARMASYAAEHGLALRPHIKTHKVPELAHRQLRAGAVGITSAKVTEAEVMLSAGLDDILLAYPVWGGHKWRRLAELSRRARITVATDSPEQAQAMASGLGSAKSDISLLVEIDVGSGRTGLPIDESLPGKLARVAECGIPVRGMMIYPGYIKEVEDAMIPALSARVAAALEAFGQAGVSAGVVSGGSTPTAFYSHMVEGLTEIRPGTYIFNDRNYASIGAASWEDCALKVRCRVVSTSVPGRAIIDGGSKAFSDAAPVHGRGFGRLVQDPDVLCEKMNEEHGYLSLEGASFRPRPGDCVDIIPNHVCTTVNMHHVLHGVRGDRVEEVFPVAAQGRIQ